MSSPQSRLQFDLSYLTGVCPMSRNAQPQQRGKVAIADLDPLGEMVELNPNRGDTQQGKGRSPAQPAQAQ